MKKKLSKRERGLIIGSSVSTLVIGSIAVLLAFAYSNESKRSVDKISSVYLQEISSQTVLNFQTNLENEFAKINTVASSMSESEVSSLSALTTYITNIKAINDFSHIAVINSSGYAYTTSGGFSLIPSLDDLDALIQGTDRFISYNETVWPEDTLILGTSFKTDLTVEGNTLKAIIVGIDAATIGEKLALNKQGVSSYSSIVDQNGAFVISNDEDKHKFGSNIFSSLSQNASFDRGYSFDKFENGVEEKGSGIVSYKIGNAHEYMYYAPIQDVNWYLCTFMSYNNVNTQISSLTNYLTFVAVLIISLIVAAGVIAFVLFTKNDRKYKELILAEKNYAIKANEYKSNFLSQISHEIRTPLNGILGMTAVAGKYLNDTERIEHCLDKIELSSRYLLNLINDVLDMSKIESGKIEIVNNPFDFNKLLKSLNTVFYHQAQNKEVVMNIFIYECNEEFLIGDELRLNQVLTNLLSNAIKFTPSGGKVSLEIYQVGKTDKEVILQFKVTDSGIGIAEENRELIFEAFTQEHSGITAKYGGTGLGLPISKSFVEKMGGTIKVDSEIGKGSVFTVTLPFGYQKTTNGIVDMNKQKVLLTSPYDMSSTNLYHHLTNFNFKVISKKDIDEEVLNDIAKDEYAIIIIDSAFSNLYKKMKDLLKKVKAKVVICGQDIDCLDQARRVIRVDSFLARPIFESDIKKMLNLFSMKTDKTENVDMGTYLLKDKHVLVVEDNEINLEIALELLNSVGAIIDTAGNGLEAIDKFSSSPIDYYDLILMDIRMPVLDGYAATTKIRALNRADSKSVIIIAMTANAFVDDVKKSFESGMDAHVTKPFDIEQIYKAYVEVLENKETKK